MKELNKLYYIEVIIKDLVQIVKLLHLINDLVSLNI